MKNCIKWNRTLYPTWRLCIIIVEVVFIRSLIVTLPIECMFLPHIKKNYPIYIKTSIFNQSLPELYKKEISKEEPVKKISGEIIAPLPNKITADYVKQIKNSVVWEDAFKRFIHDLSGKDIDVIENPTVQDNWFVVEATKNVINAFKDSMKSIEKTMSESMKNKLASTFTTLLAEYNTRVTEIIQSYARQIENVPLIELTVDYIKTIVNPFLWQATLGQFIKMLNNDDMELLQDKNPTEKESWVLNDIVQQKIAAFKESAAAQLVPQDKEKILFEQLEEKQQSLRRTLVTQKKKEEIIIEKEKEPYKALVETPVIHKKVDISKSEEKNINVENIEKKSKSFPSLLNPLVGPPFMQSVFVNRAKYVTTITNPNEAKRAFEDLIDSWEWIIEPDTQDIIEAFKNNKAFAMLDEETRNALWEKLDFEIESKKEEIRPFPEHGITVDYIREITHSIKAWSLAYNEFITDFSDPDIQIVSLHGTLRDGTKPENWIMTKENVKIKNELTLSFETITKNMSDDKKRDAEKVRKQCDERFTKKYNYFRKDYALSIYRLNFFPISVWNVMNLKNASLWKYAFNKFIQNLDTWNIECNQGKDCDEVNNYDLDKASKKIQDAFYKIEIANKVSDIIKSNLEADLQKKVQELAVKKIESSKE